MLRCSKVTCSAPLCDAFLLFSHIQQPRSSEIRSSCSTVRAIQVVKRKTVQLPLDASPSNRRLPASRAQKSSGQIKPVGTALLFALTSIAALLREPSPPTAHPRRAQHSARPGAPPAPSTPSRPHPGPQQRTAPPRRPGPIHCAAERLSGPRAAPCRDRPRVGAHRAAERGAPRGAREDTARPREGHRCRLRRSREGPARPWRAPERSPPPRTPLRASHGEWRRRLRLALLGGKGRPVRLRGAPVRSGGARCGGGAVRAEGSGRSEGSGLGAASAPTMLRAAAPSVGDAAKYRRADSAASVAHARAPRVAFGARHRPPSPRWPRPLSRAPAPSSLLAASRRARALRTPSRGAGPAVAMETGGGAGGAAAARARVREKLRRHAVRLYQLTFIN